MGYRVWSLLLLLLSGTAAAEDGTVTVLYAGSLVNLMQHAVPQALPPDLALAGYGAGSGKLANEIKGRLRQGDVFISANPKVDDALSGAANGDWVRWYVTFAESPLLLGINPNSRFVKMFETLPWVDVLLQPGFRLGRTDPALDPKGALSVTLMQRAEEFYHRPGLAQQVLGDPRDSPQVLPEEALIGRLQSGELDAGFFYSTETSEASITALPLPAEIGLKATYTATILQGAPHPAAAEKFLLFLLGPSGRALLQAHGLTLLAPRLSGDAATLPAALRTVIEANP